jgi:hypothetical protein
MQPNFERAIETQKYFGTFVAMFRVFLQQRHRPNVEVGASIPRPTHLSTPSDRENIYQDPDPPTPHWGC